MSLLDDPSFRIIGNGGVRTRFKTRDSAEPTFTYKNYPRPDKSEDSDKSSENSKK